MIVDPITVLQEYGLEPTVQEIDRLEQAALVAGANAGATFTADPDRLVTCPYCDRGTETGPNGESWRCGTCDGTARTIGPRTQENPA